MIDRLLQLETFAVRLQTYLKETNNKHLVHVVENLLFDFNYSFNCYDGCTCEEEEESNDIIGGNDCPVHDNLLFLLSNEYHAKRADLHECATNIAMY